jgi:hypothetical protein
VGGEGGAPPPPSGGRTGKSKENSSRPRVLLSDVYRTCFSLGSQRVSALPENVVLLLGRGRGFRSRVATTRAQWHLLWLHLRHRVSTV